MQPDRESLADRLIAEIHHLRVELQVSRVEQTALLYEIAKQVRHVTDNTRQIANWVVAVGVVAIVVAIGAVLAFLNSAGSPPKIW